VNILTECINNTINTGSFHALTEELEFQAFARKGHDWENYLKRLGLYTTLQVREKLRIRKVSQFFK